MKFTKGKKADPTFARCICAIPGESDVCPACGPTLKTAAEHKRRVKAANPNPWIDKRYFDVVLARCAAAENMCKDLIKVIAVDDGEFLASHDSDYLAAGQAILKGDV